MNRFMTTRQLTHKSALSAEECAEIIQTLHRDSAVQSSCLVELQPLEAGYDFEIKLYHRMENAYGQQRQVGSVLGEITPTDDGADITTQYEYLNTLPSLIAVALGTVLTAALMITLIRGLMTFDTNANLITLSALMMIVLFCAVSTALFSIFALNHYRQIEQKDLIAALDKAFSGKAGPAKRKNHLAVDDGETADTTDAVETQDKRVQKR
jgi:hypothetical protein